MQHLFPARISPGSTARSPVTPGDLDAAYWVPDPGVQHVSAVMISSADGAVQADGRSAGLGNDADRRLFALLRAQSDAILVGAGTARTEGYGGDRPSAAMRAVRAAHRLAPVPRMVVVTSRAELDPDGPLFTDTEVPPIVVTSAAAPAERLRILGGRCEVIVAGGQRVDVAQALDALRDRGLRRITCEGGPTLLAQVIAAGRLDELRLTLSPVLLAGGGLRATVGPVLDPAVTLELVQVLEVDSFLLLRYRVGRRTGRAAG